MLARAVDAPLVLPEAEVPPEENNAMRQHLSVYELPTQFDPVELAGTTAVVIDVLRATTSILYALDAGAAEVIPCLEIDDALRAAADYPRSRVVLGGERGGLRIEGFDLGNSPLEYAAPAVAGKTVVMTTTNGTRAMARCRAADEVLVGAFVNAGALADRLASRQRIALVCAGSDDDVTRDDVLFAGLLVDRLQRGSRNAYRLNVHAIDARQCWIDAIPRSMASGGEKIPPGVLADQLRKSLAGQKLVAIGMEDDLYAAAQLDRFQLVPQLDTARMRIQARPATGKSGSG